MKLKLRYAIVAMIAVLFTTNAQVSENEPAARQWIKSHSKELKIKPTDVFKLSFVFKSEMGEVLRFQQMMNNVPVYQSEIVVNFNPSKELVFTSDSYDASIVSIATTPALSQQDALNVSKENLKFTGDYTVSENSLNVMKINNQTALVYRVVSNFQIGNGSWEVLIDANNGTIFSTTDISIKHHIAENVSKSNSAKTNAALVPFAPVTGTAMVYMSDPLSFAQVPYGTAGYVDGSDANTTQLTAARTAVILPEIDLTAGVYKLKSTYVEIVDSEAPSKGLFTQATSAFNFTRNQDGFEAANAFYHLDKNFRYINETLGITCRPAINGGVLRFDPSGWNGADNSSFSPTTALLSFGEGCVDDAEDTDVIIHELGHGVHNFLTNGSTSAFIGEGSSDYWAQSYGRSVNAWNSSNEYYQYMFKWDGHNTCWDGRSTDYFGLYPGDLIGNQGGAAHTDGQIWATALMQIYDVVGRTKMDKAFLNGLALTNSSSNQQTSAIAVRQAAINMNYPCADIQVFTQKFSDRGYTMPTLALTMAAIANQTVSADASNTYTLPSYATLANPITANCNASLTQSPSVGTVLAPGVYTITMTAVSGTTVARSFQLTVSPNLGVEEIVKNNFVLYPNPAASILNIKGEFDSNESVTIFNMLGQIVLRKAVSTSEESIDIAALSSGIYNVYFNNAKVTYKFVKK